MESDSGMMLSSVRDILYVVFRHKWKIAGFFVLTVAVVTGVTFVLPMVYRSEAVLLMRIGRENLPADPSVQSTMVNVTQDRTSDVRSEVAILTSHGLAEEVVDAIGEGWILDRADLRREELPLEAPEEPAGWKRPLHGVRDAGQGLLVALDLKEPLGAHEEAVNKVIMSLRVDVQRQTNIINVGYEARSGPLAQVVLEKLLGRFMERHLEVFATQVSPEFFQGHVARLEQELAQSEKKLDEFRGEFGIAEMQAQKEGLLEQIGSLEGELSDCRADADGLRAQVAALDKALKEYPREHELARTTGLTNYAWVEIKERLIDLRIQETDLSERYPDSHRPLVELREKIRQLEEALAQEEEHRTEITSGLNANYEGWKHTLEVQRSAMEAQLARVKVLETEIARHRQTLAELASREMKLIQLERDRELTEAEYRQYRAQLHQANISAALDLDKVSNVSIVQPASRPSVPIKPRKIRNVVLGILVGLFGGLCFAFVVEYLDDSLNTTEAAQKRLGVPVLAAVSRKEFKKACI